MADVLEHVEQRARWRSTWAEVRGTPRQCAFIRGMYAEIEKEILAGETKNKYLVDWDFTPIESDLWHSIRMLGLPFWPQYPVSRFFVDFGDPVRRVALECDGKRWHDAKRDADRDAELGYLGWTVIRFPGWQCFKGDDDEQSAHHRILRLAEQYYPSSLR